MLAGAAKATGIATALLLVIQAAVLSPGNGDATQPDAPTVTDTAEPTATAPTATDTAEPTAAAPTATDTPEPTATATTGPPSPPPTLTSLCLNPSAIKSAARCQACDKIGAQYGRWLRDWASWIANSRNYGYQSGSPVEPQLGDGGAGCNELPNELVCSETGLDSSPCTGDLCTDTDHCQEKMLYQNECTQDDWYAVWQWLGNPNLPTWGYCSLDGTRYCTTDAQCSGVGTCVKKCDVYKFGTASGADPDPPGSIPPPPGTGSGPRYGWEICRCYAEEFIIPQLKEWLSIARTYDRYDTPAVDTISAACADAAFNQMGNDIAQYVISGGCVGCCDGTCGLGVDEQPCTYTSECGAGSTCQIASECLTHVHKIYQGWNSMQVGNNCGTSGCSMTQNGAGIPICDAATACPNAQITCDEWQTIAAAALKRLRPIRYATRERRGGLGGGGCNVARAGGGIWPLAFPALLWRRRSARCTTGRGRKPRTLIGEWIWRRWRS